MAFNKVDNITWQFVLLAIMVQLRHSASVRSSTPGNNNNNHRRKESWFPRKKSRQEVIKERNTRGRTVHGDCQNNPAECKHHFPWANILRQEITLISYPPSQCLSPWCGAGDGFSRRPERDESSDNGEKAPDDNEAMPRKLHTQKDRNYPHS